ncbi:MAG: hypothetical protein ABSA45_06200 [Verrucomicrobiota bacterium]|jgi:hypothetical protein
MTTKTRNWLITLLILASPFLFFLVLLLFWTAEPLPPVAPLPAPNGYDDLVKAGKTVTADAGDYHEMDEAQLGELVARNAEALQRLRAGLSNQCRVPVQFSQTYAENHLNELAAFKRLAQVLAAEGRRAEMEGHPGNAAKSYLDAIHLGNESARGGVVIDQLVGTAIEHIGTDGLQEIAGQFNAKSCRETAATLETLDSQRQTWNEVMQQERDWSRRAFPGVRNEFFRLMTRNSLNQAFQQAEEKFNQQQERTRQLTVDLAVRAYELDIGHSPASMADLVPVYLKAVPQNPFTGTNMSYMPK